jgi:DNA-binding NtrC family response regulator
LQKHNWTGNIRELRNVVERLVILSGKDITVGDVDAYVYAEVGLNGYTAKWLNC